MALLGALGVAPGATLALTPRGAVRRLVEQLARTRKLFCVVVLKPRLRPCVRRLLPVVLRRKLGSGGGFGEQSRCQLVRSPQLLDRLTRPLVRRIFAGALYTLQLFAEAVGVSTLLIGKPPRRLGHLAPLLRGSRVALERIIGRRRGFAPAPDDLALLALGGGPVTKALQAWTCVGDRSPLRARSIGGERRALDGARPPARAARREPPARPRPPARRRARRAERR